MLPSGQYGRSSVEPSGSSAWCVDVMLMPSSHWGHKVRFQSCGSGINQLQGVSQGTIGVLEGTMNFCVAHARGVTGQPWHIALLCRWHLAEWQLPWNRRQWRHLSYLLLQRTETNQHFKEKGRNTLVPALPGSVVGLVTDTDEDYGSDFHWKGFSSGGHMDCRYLNRVKLCLFYFTSCYLLSRQSSVNIPAERYHEGAGNSEKAGNSREKK